MKIRIQDHREASNVMDKKFFDIEGSMVEDEISNFREKGGM